MIKNGKLESLQILRGLAALSIVLYHYRFYMVPDKADMTIPNKLFGWGSIGVDLFFVISGFIMVYITNGKQAGMASWKAFITGRLFRILPTYYVILLITFFINGAMSIFHYQDKVDNLISAITFIPYLISPAPFYIDPDGMYNIRWTLNYELYFYIVFSICILSGKKIAPVIIWFVFTSCMGFLYTGSFQLSKQGYNTQSIIFNFMTNPIILEFIIGVFSGLMYFYLRKQSEKFKMVFLVCSLIFIAILISNMHKSYLYTAMMFSLIVVNFTVYNERISKVTPKILVKMGDVSFSWYLVHNPFIHAAGDHLERYVPNLVRSGYGFIFFTFVSFLIACMSHKYLENILTNKIRNVFIKKGNKVLTT
ncbi:acyltransferase [Salmonella enterica subsp. enterica serovar Typhimurium]|nr:acyltransferase [Salmonella enterica subsp. enterica serovar Typhimurium]EIF3374608.1 acyltransferase [Salmonella enterica subsp. enterica serovar Typhimurium]EII7208627.1 acyltransferase [Salmonella enterica subsp. enterica serovar Typhimurium]EIP0078552.1 acyltransferase [Salmonella enterica subsp. enterica serovar Typhimurium]EIW9447300.1 acyltransferase [Salmonella enterica subsp. enterica serovar Typhimurium]